MASSLFGKHSLNNDQAPVFLCLDVATAVSILPPRSPTNRLGEPLEINVRTRRLFSAGAILRILDDRQPKRVMTPQTRRHGEMREAEA